MKLDALAQIHNEDANEIDDEDADEDDDEPHGNSNANNSYSRTRMTKTMASNGSNSKSNNKHVTPLSKKALEKLEQKGRTTSNKAQRESMVPDLDEDYDEDQVAD